MFVISGISGNTGSAAASALLEAGHPVRAIVRSVGRASEWAGRGVELVEGDLADAAGMRRALEGARAAYMLVPPDPLHPDPLGFYRIVAEAIRTASKAAGLKRLVFLSSEGAHLPERTGPILGAHFAEGILAGVAPDVTFVRPSFFHENWQPVFAVAASDGIMPSLLQPLEAPRPQIAAADIGETVAALLTESAPPAIVEMSGPELCSAADAARAMSEALGREVSPLAVPREAWADSLMAAGLGRSYAELVCEMYDGINAGHVRFSGEGEHRRGRRTLAETISGWAV